MRKQETVEERRARKIAKNARLRKAHRLKSQGIDRRAKHDRLNAEGKLRG